MSSRSQNLTFEDVAAAIEAVIASGEHPTMRRVHLKLGRGSMKTISAFAREYFSSARFLMSLNHNEISDEFFGAVVAEMKRVISKRNKEIEIQLDTAHENVENLEQDLERIEGELMVYKAQLEAAAEKNRREAHDSEVRQARLEERLDTATTKIQELENEKGQLSEKIQQLNTEIALSGQRETGGGEIIARLEKEIAGLQETNKQLLAGLLAPGKTASPRVPPNNKGTHHEKGSTPS